ncbi:MAG: hypothetical protein J0L80_06065 [Chitinophagales bacterium]|jgi:hypothetical protein|nr:hypothetical protein [Chitinophagales bacterium]
MSSRSFFQIFFKISALLTIVGSVGVLIESLQSIVSFFSYTDYTILFIAIISIALLVFTVYFLLFKGDYIINKLHLTDNVDEHLSIKMHRSQILSLAVVVIGGYTFVNEIPVFCHALYSYWQEGLMEHSYSYTSKGPIIYSSARLLVGLLLLGNTKLIVNYLELRRKK